MHVAVIVPLLCLLTGCLAPGTRDPTRYPWDPRNKLALTSAPHPRIEARGMIPRVDTPPSPQPVPPGASFCIMAIEQERQTGINISANSGVMACAARANSAPANPAPGSPR